MSDENRPQRPYRKRRRAEQEAQTRLKITEAAVKLHGTVGPARTTISDVAAEAGVQRGTVYRHFRDLEALFLSCSAHWASLNPPPDPAGWLQIGDPDARLLHALTELYTWYEWAEPMLTNVTRDAPLVPASARAGERFQRHFEALHGALMNGRRASGRAGIRTAAAIGHALEFATWRSLIRQQGLQTNEAVELMIALAAAARQACLTDSLETTPPPARSATPSQAARQPSRGLGGTERPTARKRSA
jgi:AcrR family transcriptional regulator